MLEKLELSLTNSNWEDGLHLSNIILDNDQNNIDACNGKTLSLIGLKKFKEARDFISILPEEILNDKKIKVLFSKIEVAEKSSEASKKLVHLEKALKDNPNDIKAHIDLSNAFFGTGKISECYQLLIQAIKIDPNWNDQEARKKLISFINSHDLNSQEAKKARRQLSSILFS